MKVFSIIIILVALYEVQAGSKRMCGEVLVQVLDATCLNGYNSIVVKKSVPMHNDLDVISMYNDIEDEDLSHTKTSILDDLLMGEHMNAIAKTRRRRNLLGIYDECCVKGCSFSELQSYCK